MIQIKNILRCYAMGMGIKGISNVFNLSRNTVRRYVHKYLDSGLTLDRLSSMSEEHLQEMLTRKGREHSSGLISGNEFVEFVAATDFVGGAE